MISLLLWSQQVRVLYNSSLFLANRSPRLATALEMFGDLHNKWRINLRNRITHRVLFLVMVTMWNLPLDEFRNLQILAKEVKFAYPGKGSMLNLRGSKWQANDNM